jgi:beta-lactamase regulating signal transducer with metallopeptidase domain
MIGALLDHLWQSTLFCGGVWLLMFGLRANGAALRHWLWMLASLKFLLPFSVLFSLGSLAGLFPPVAAQPDLFGEAFSAAAPVVSPTSSLSIAVSPDVPAALGLEALLTGVWATGASLVFLRWLAAWRAASRISRAARPAPGAPPDARITDENIEPSAARVFHPVVLLPAALLGKLTGPQLQAVLAHEREHISRHDNLKANVHRVVEALFWFYPLVWWIGHRLLEERERACDEAVIDRGHDPADYAAGILAVCRHCCPRTAGSPPPALLSSATAGNLTERIREILAAARPRSLGFIKAGVLCACTLVVATVPVFAGAFDHALHRYNLMRSHANALDSAEVSIARAAPDGSPFGSVLVNGDRVLIRNSSLRDLVALAYGVESSKIVGFDSLLDDARYDVFARLPRPVDEPENFDPHALQGTVTKLLASRFGMEIHVNRRCQDPCGRVASLDPPDTR